MILTMMLTFVLCDTALAQTSDPPAPEPLILTDKQSSYPLGLHLEILEDPTGELTIDDVSSPEFEARFIPSQQAVPNYGFTDSVYWVRFRLDNQTHQTYEWLLEQGFANTQFIDLYSPLPDGVGFSLKQTGVLRPPSTRDIPYPLIVFNLTIPPESQQTFYLRFQNGAAMTVSLTLWMKDAFLVNSQTEQVIQGLFYGILIGLLAYNLFLLLFSFREASSLYYVSFLASFIFFIASYDGYTQIYFLHDLFSLTQYYIPLSWALTFMSTVLFTNDFLKIKTHNKRLYRVSIVILGVWVLLFFLTPFSNYHVLTLLMVPWALLSLVVVFIAMIISLQTGFKAARFFLIAWFGLLVTLSMVILVRLGVLPSTIFSENAFRLGLVWMAVCWSLALADRFNLLKAEAESATLELRNNKNRLSQILEGLPLGVVLYGKDYKPQYVNRRTAEILNNPVRDVQVNVSAGRTLEQAIQYFSLKVADSDQEYPIERLPIHSALQGEPASADDIEMDLGDRRVPLEIWASPLRDETGNIISAIAAFQDISERKQAENERYISETRFGVIAENNPDGIAFMARDRKVLYVSPSYLRMVGKTAEELIGQTGIGLVHPDDRDYTERKFNEALQHPNTRVLAEYRIPHKDGSYIWVETFAINLLDNPQVQAVVLISHDITNRKQKEVELAEYRQHLESLVEKRTAELSNLLEISRDISAAKDLDVILNRIMERLKTFVNYQGLVILVEQGNKWVTPAQDWPSSSAQSKPIELAAVEVQAVVKDFTPGSPILIRNSNPDEANLNGFRTIITRLSSRNNSDIHCWIGMPLLEKGYILGALVIGCKQLDATQDQVNIIEAFANQMAIAIENNRLYQQIRAAAMVDERNRLARDLHDSVTQTLFTASVLAEATPRIWDKDPPIARQNLDKLSLLIRGALAEMRSMLIELRSGELHEQTLSQLIHTVVEAAQGRSRATFNASIMDIPELPIEVTSAFYRIGREAVNNVIVHARATQADISLVEKRGQVELRIQDNGRGFDIQAVQAGHLGIKIMVERAATIGADLSVQSEPGNGTEITATWSRPGWETVEHD